MTASTLEHVYRYAFASDLKDDQWQLAAAATTTSKLSGQQQFFNGSLRSPHVTARLLLVLSQIVRTHFFDARPPQMDPIVTSSPKLVRWEGFSGCCGAYVRVDLDGRAFDDAEQTFGTTNVDFNPKMIGHLSRIARRDDVRLSIDQGQVEVAASGESVIEKKVPLPRRWVKGLSEVQAYQTKLLQKATIKPATLTRLLQTMGSGGKGVQYLSIHGVNARLSTRGTAGAIAIGGAERLKVLMPLLPLVVDIGLWSDEESQTFAASLEVPVGRFWMVLSPTLQRGFSGEGQVLETLAKDSAHIYADDMYDLLGWQSELHPAELAVKLGCSVDDARASLGVLSTRGIAGFDAITGYYFHRELPFDMSKVERDQPRLLGARKLLENGAVKLLGDVESGHDLEVEGSQSKHFVKLRIDGDRCTCVWFSKHQGQRGPCKHILAAKIFIS